MHLLKQFIQYSFVNSTINLHFYTCTFLFNVSGNVKAYMAFVQYWLMTYSFSDIKYHDENLKFREI